MGKILKVLKTMAPLVALISFLLAMILPLHPSILNIAIVFSFALSITVYMRASTINEWYELKTFPSILLLSAIFRIALNIATTRKILEDGEPGKVVEAAGNLIAGGNIYIGFVIFIILFIVQFLIVSQGTTRITEVKARFTLDGLPMKQMSIDNDLNNGIINPEQAKEKRKELDQQIDFYGNMDGAGKFIKGDVTASIILFLVNLIVGFIVGMVVHGMGIAEAAQHYTILTIGDGLVSQICSMLLATGAAVVMTRVYNQDGTNLAENIIGELTFNPFIVNFVGGIFAMLGVLGLFSELPAFPFLLMSAILFYIGYQRKKNIEEEETAQVMQTRKEEEQENRMQQEKFEVSTEIEPITVELGMGLLPMVGQGENDAQNDTLQNKIKIMRMAIAKELGVKIPKIHVVDDSSLFPYTKYRIKIKDNLIAEGELRIGKLLALKTPYVIKDISGEPTKDPIFGEDAVWISETEANDAKDAGYMIYDPLTILSTHLNETIRRHLYELLERQDVQDLVDQVAKTRKVLLKEIEEAKIPLAVIQSVLKNLLREALSIRDLSVILEAIIDGNRIMNEIFANPANASFAKSANVADEITTLVRERISKYICEKSKNEDGKIYLITLHPTLEKELQIAPRYDGYHLKMNMMEEQKLIASLIQEIQRSQMAGIGAVLFTTRSDVRFGLARMVHKYNIPIAIITQNELVQGIVLEQVGTVSVQEES